MSDNDFSRTCFATFILRGKGLNPDEVTDSLGINPSKSFKRGDWRTKTERWTRNFWSLTSQGEVHSDDLSLHIQWLLNQFEPMNDKLQDILKRNEVEGEISCFWILPSNHEGLSLGRNVIDRMANMEVKLDFDIYYPD